MFLDRFIHVSVTNSSLFVPLGEAFESALVHALVTLADNIELDLRVFGIVPSDSTHSLLNVFLIVFEIPVLGSSEYLELALHMLCKAASCLPLPAQAKLARVWARHSKPRLQGLLQSLQQLITVKVIGGSFTRDYCVQDADTITAPTKVMKILYYASMLAGELDGPELRRDDKGDGPDLEKTPGQRSSVQVLQVWYFHINSNSLKKFLLLIYLNLCFISRTRWLRS